MSSFNKVFLMGNLTRDVELKFLANQTPVAECGMAINRKFKTAAGEQREDVTFVDITGFGKTAEFLSQYFTKGKPIFIEGHLKYDSWDDKNSGAKRTKLSVVVDSVQFVGGKSDDAPAQPSRGPTQRPVKPELDEHGIDPNDIPFAWEGRISQPL
jgi:single-strand DNA-binding protein